MSKIHSAVTRALVVSTKDPLCSGRVKVWIPIFHGAPRTSSATDAADSGDEPTEPVTDGQGLVDLQKVTPNSGNEQATWNNSDDLPWAYVLGHNWGPIGNINTGLPLYTANQPNGVMCIPKVGTEVFVIFNDDHPDQPIIIGSVFHKDELLAMSSVTGLELSPGVGVTNESALLSTGSYERSVSESYVIRSTKGSSLILSDIPDNEQIILGGSLSPKQTAGSFVNGPGTQYNAFATSYPNFPTTASAGLAKRTMLSRVTTTATATSLAPASVVVGGTRAPGTTPATNKQYPINGSFNPPDPNQGMTFQAERNGRLHNGIDLGTSGRIGLPLVAPIAGQVLYYRVNPTGSGGNYLVFKGSDGYAHRFMHLDSIAESVKTNILQNKYPELPVGTVIGACGGSGQYKDKAGVIKTYKPHLHWEVIRLVSGNVSYANQINASNANTLFTSAQNTSATLIPGTAIQVSTASFLDPIKSWISADTGSSLIVSGDQVANTGQAMTPDPNDVGHNKIIGLEVCLTPGKEHIYLRHSSGSYLGFDADGNFKLFTVGDAQLRVNRSVVADILGAVTTACFAVFTRAKSIIRTAAASAPIHRTNGHQFDPVAKDKSKTYDEFPSAILDIDTTRLSDMADMLIQSTNNPLYVTSATGNSTKTADQTKADGFNYVLSAAEKPDKAFAMTKWDQYIQQSFTSAITNGKEDEITAVKESQYFTWRLLKAMMLHESNGNASLVNGKAYGLFQLQLNAVRDVKGKVKDANGKEKNPVEFIFDKQNGKMDTYLGDGKENITTAIYYFKKCLNQVYNAYVSEFKALGIVRNLKTDMTSKEKDSMVMLAVFAYTAGYSETSRLVRSSLSGQVPLVSYISVEDAMVKSNTPIVQQSYVPIVISHILPKLT